MSDTHSFDSIKKHRKVYVAVFVALLVGTIVTVLLRSLHFSAFWITAAIALTVATIKASLVAAFFMHLSNERKAIYSTLLVTAFLLVAMMYLFIHARTDVPLGTEFRATKQVPHAPAPADK